MNTVNYLCHTDGSPYTEREMKLDAERATQRAAQNYTHYSDSKNRERTADALESIADSLESIAGDVERLADFILTHTKGE